jgi:uncharacterized protein (TIGR03435 family)
MKTLLTVLAFTGLSGAADLQIGGPAPPLTLSSLLQAPSGTDITWKALEGHAVVLEFWATWCLGCRDQISHLNRLEEQFRNRPVRFIALTDEGPEIVQRFLKDYRISGWIGLDSNEQTFNRYNIKGRPTTVLIDPAGVVRGVGNASALKSDTLEKLLSGKPITFSFSTEAAGEAKRQPLPEPFYQTMVRLAGPVSVTQFSPGAVSGTTGRRWETWGVGLQRLLADAYGIPESRIDGPSWLSSERYDVFIAAPGLDEGRRLPLLRRTLEETFQLKVRRESRESDVYVLHASPGIEPKLRLARSGTSSRWGKTGDITGVSLPVASIIGIAGQAIGKTVIDETGLEGHFDFELKWDVTNPQSLVQAVRSQLGLELTPSRRPLGYLIVDSATKPQSW